MARSYWGKVYLNDSYVGELREESGGRCVFTYDDAHLEGERPPAAIAHTLPVSEKRHVSERGLHPFFDNLVAEGWLRKAQARALGVDPEKRFALLLGFGHDLAGAVSVEDPDPQARPPLDHADDATVAALLGRASLSGIQRKLLVVADGKTFRPVRPNETSTHIAKLASGNLAGLLEIEYLTTKAVRVLLPDDDVAEMQLTSVPAIKEDALIITRFDRTPSGKRIHFEEFNQLLGKYSGDDKYEDAYETMGQFILRTPGCIPAEAYRLMRRIFACLLVGNTDAHLKNFAMFHKSEGLRLTPAYDLVAAAVYPEYQTIALPLAGERDMKIGLLQPKHLIAMGGGFGMKDDVVVAAIEQIGELLPDALSVIESSDVGSKALHDSLRKKMEKRWKGSFALTGRRSSKRRNNDEKPRG